MSLETLVCVAITLACRYGYHATKDKDAAASLLWGGAAFGALVCAGVVYVVYIFTG
jgi:hypothetical protein